VTQRAGHRRGAVSLQGKALQWLSQREHSRAELTQKLLRWQADQARSLERANQVRANLDASQQLELQEQLDGAVQPDDPIDRLGAT
jgi:SOS response regulatory protein OraA/RecX